MYEKELNIYQSIKNIKKYCEANCNHGECKTCIFYSPFCRKFICDPFYCIYKILERG